MKKASVKEARARKPVAKKAIVKKADAKKASVKKASAEKESVKKAATGKPDAEARSLTLRELHHLALNLPASASAEMPAGKTKRAAKGPAPDANLELARAFLAGLPARAARRKLTPEVMIKIAGGRHGPDDRTTIDKLVGTIPSHAAALTAARGVGLLISSDGVTVNGAEVRLKAAPEDMSGPYSHEPCVPVTFPGTAFLVTRRHAITAAHCVAFRDPRSLNLAFGFGTKSALAADGSYYTLPRTLLAKVDHIVALVKDPRLGDLAVLYLREPMVGPGVVPLALAPERSTKLAQEVGLLTHARAQPLKAVVRAANDPDPGRYPQILDQNDRFLYTNLDTFRGSSGSPVIDTRGRVVGVQFRGEGDADPIGNPRIFSEALAGSWATRIEVIKDALAAIGAPLPMA